MSNQEDLYKILEVSENASDEEIKKSYKRLAVKWHPDKNQDNREVAEKKFKEISHAFSVLKDKQQKQEYDMMRKGGYSMGGGKGHNFHDFDFRSHDMGFDFYDNMFKDFFKSSGFGDFSGFDRDDDGFFSSNFSSNFGGVGSTSTKTMTTIINGKKVTKTEKTFIDKDGKKVTEVIESDGNGNTTKKMISGGSSTTVTNSIQRGGSNQLSHFQDDDDDFGFGFGGMGGGFGNMGGFSDPFFHRGSGSGIGNGKRKK